MMLLEIVTLLFREQSAESLFKVVQETEDDHRQQRDVKLRQLREEEEAKQAAILK